MAYVYVFFMYINLSVIFGLYMFLWYLLNLHEVCKFIFLKQLSFYLFV